MNSKNAKKSDVKSLSSLLNKRADIYFELKDYKNALKHMFQILLIGGNVNSELCFQIACCERNIGNYKEAIDFFNVAIKTSYDVQPQYYIERGFAYFMQEEYLFASKDLIKGLKWIIIHPQAVRTLALCYEKLGDITEAMKNMLLAAEQGDQIALDYMKDLGGDYKEEELNELLREQILGQN